MRGVSQLNLIKRLLKNPFDRARIILLAVLILEALAFFFLPKIFAGSKTGNIHYRNLPILIIHFLNALVAYYYSYKTMQNYDFTDYHRKIWRFVMFSMFFLMLGNLVSILVIYVFKVYASRPPSWAEWFGLLWVLPLLLVAISREYSLVKTASPPGKIMKIGLLLVLVVYALMLTFVSPILAPGVFTTATRMISLWNIGFAFACIIVSIAVLSEIHKGLLSRSWKIITTAILFFSVNYAIFQFISANRIIINIPLLPLLSQVGTLLIILASYIELKMTS
jgi:hypothetical protein